MSQKTQRPHFQISRSPWNLPFAANLAWAAWKGKLPPQQCDLHYLMAKLGYGPSGQTCHRGGDPPKSPFRRQSSSPVPGRGAARCSLTSAAAAIPHGAGPGAPVSEKKPAFPLFS